MKRKILILVLIALLSVPTIYLVKSVGDEYIAKTAQSREINEMFVNMQSMTTTYSGPNDLSDVLPLELNEPVNFRFAFATSNVVGRVSVKITSEDGTSVFEWSGKNGHGYKEFALKEGKYNLEFETAKWGFLKIGYRVDSPAEKYLGVQPKPDTDGDGLTDEMEIELGLNIHASDTDEDGLSDYFETVKYKTNPNDSDSDDDGLKDSEWGERREYTYSIQAIVDLRPPYSLDEMNDFHQDARSIKMNDNGSEQIEVIIYPEAEVLINPAVISDVANEYTRSTYTKNYGSQMILDMKEIADGCETDIQLLYKTLEEFYTRSSYVDPSESLGYGSTLPILFHMYKDADGNVIEDNLAGTSTYSIEEVKERNVYADSMYELGLHGACGSTSVLKGAMMRAAGLEERTIFTIPLIFSYDVDNTVYDIKAPYDRGYRNLPSSDGVSISDHFFHEVKLGQQWVRVDSEAQVSHQKSLTSGANQSPVYIKLLDCIDVTDENFYQTWNYESWNENRGYVYRSVLENTGVNMVKN